MEEESILIIRDSEDETNEENEAGPSGITSTNNIGGDVIPPNMKTGKDDDECDILYKEFLAKISSSTDKDLRTTASRLQMKYSKASEEFKKSEYFKTLLKKAIAIMPNEKCYIFIKELYLALKANALDLSQEEGFEIFDKKTMKKIKIMEKAQRELMKKIQELDQTEVDSDDENSAYLKVDRYKKRLIEVTRRLCKYRNVDYARYINIQYRNRIKIKNASEIDKAVEKYYNKTKEMMNYSDVFKLVKNVNEYKGLGFSPQQLEREAKTTFEKLGETVKKIRQKEFYEEIMMDGGLYEDPADEDPKLNEILEMNKRQCEKRLDEVMSKYSNMQDGGEEQGEDSKEEDTEGESSIEEDEADVSDEDDSESVSLEMETIDLCGNSDTEVSNDFIVNMGEVESEDDEDIPSNVEMKGKEVSVKSGEEKENKKGANCDAKEENVEIEVACSFEASSEGEDVQIIQEVERDPLEGLGQDLLSEMNSSKFIGETNEAEEGMENLECAVEIDGNVEVERELLEILGHDLLSKANSILEFSGKTNEMEVMENLECAVEIDGNVEVERDPLEILGHDLLSETNSISKFGGEMNKMKGMESLECAVEMDGNVKNNLVQSDLVKSTATSLGKAGKSGTRNDGNDGLEEQKVELAPLKRRSEEVEERVTKKVRGVLIIRKIPEEEDENAKVEKYEKPCENGNTGNDDKEKKETPVVITLSDREDNDDDISFCAKRMKTSPNCFPSTSVKPSVIPSMSARPSVSQVAKSPASSSRILPSLGMPVFNFNPQSYIQDIIKKMASGFDSKSSISETCPKVSEQVVKQYPGKTRDEVSGSSQQQESILSQPQYSRPIQKQDSRQLQQQCSRPAQRQDFRASQQQGSKPQQQQCLRRPQKQDAMQLLLKLQQEFSIPVQRQDFEASQQQGSRSLQQQGSRPPQQKGSKPPQQQRSIPPQQQRSRPPQQQGSRPPQQQGSRPPQQQRSIPPQQQRSRPPQQQGSRPPQQQGSRPPQQQGSRPPQQQGSRPPQQQGARPPQQQGSRPPQQQCLRPPQKQDSKSLQRQSSGSLQQQGFRTLPKQGPRPLLQQGFRSFQHHRTVNPLTKPLSQTYPGRAPKTELSRNITQQPAPAKSRQGIPQNSTHRAPGNSNISGVSVPRLMTPVKRFANSSSVRPTKHFFQNGVWRPASSCTPTSGISQTNNRRMPAFSNPNNLIRTPINTFSSTPIVNTIFERRVATLASCGQLETGQINSSNGRSRSIDLPQQRQSVSGRAHFAPKKVPIEKSPSSNEVITID